MSQLLWEKSGAWRWLVKMTRDSKPFFIGFATVCGVVPGVIGYFVMQVTNSSNPELEAKLRKNARPESLMMGQVNKERLAEYLGELQRKEDTNDRYKAALKGETFTRNPYARIQPIPKPTDKEADKEQKREVAKHGFMDDNEDRVLVADELEIADVAGLKSHIERHHGIPSDNQIIVFQDDILHDEVFTASDVDWLPGDWMMYKKISPNESISVEVCPAGHLPDSVFRVGITSEKSVLDLKLMIDKEFGVPPRRQELWTRNAFMEDERSLRDYIVARSLKVRLDEFPVNDTDALRVRICGEGIIFSDLLIVDKNDTVYTLHGHIRRKGIASGHDFYLTCEDGLGLTGTSTLEELDITDGASLYLVSGNKSSTDSSSDSDAVADE